MPLLSAHIAGLRMRAAGRNACADDEDGDGGSGARRITSMMWTEKSWKKIHEDGGEVIGKLEALVIVRIVTGGNGDGGDETMTLAMTGTVKETDEVAGDGGGEGIRERPAKEAMKRMPIWWMT